MTAGDDGKVWAAGYTDCVGTFASADACDRIPGGVFGAFVPGLTLDGAFRARRGCIGNSIDEAVRIMLCAAHGPMIPGLAVRSIGFPVPAGFVGKRRWLLLLPPRAHPWRALEGLAVLTFLPVHSKIYR
ncbi:MAG: hypothetical protein ACYDIE_00775 [Candidatus Krumholzibacteriia bacterium]